MGPITLTAGINEGRDTVRIEIAADGRPLAEANLDAVDLDALIHDLGVLRGAMTEPVTPSLDPHARVDFVRDPAWLVPDAHSGPGGTTLLTLRHPGFGWLGFLLEWERARAIGAALERWSKGPSSG